MLSAFAAYNSNGNIQKKNSTPKIIPRKKKNIRKADEVLNKVKKNNMLRSKSKLTHKRLRKMRHQTKNIQKSQESYSNRESAESYCLDTDINGIETQKISPKKIVKYKQKRLRKVNDVDGDTFTKPLSLLSWLLAPMQPPEFFNTYWEVKPLHIVRKHSDYFKNILTSKDIDRILRDNSLYYTRNIDVVTYENGERQTHNPEGRAIPANVWDYYMNGCSVRIMNPHTYSTKVRSMLSNLQEYFGTMVGVNVYLTPPGSQGFAPHYDDIEAFVIQLEGHKNWKIYSPTKENAVLPRYSSKNLSRDELGTPLDELTLNAGDLLYFPRGFIHEASTDSNEHSLHITVSVYQNTAYVDLLEKLLPQALKTASEFDVNFRKGLPLNYLQHVGAVNAEKKSTIRKEILNRTKELICKLVDYASIDMAADQLGRKFMYEALPPQIMTSEKERSSKEDGDRFENGVVTNIASFSPDTMVRFTRYHSQRLVVEDNAVRMYYCTENANVYHGEEEQFLELDEVLIDTVKSLQKNYPQYVSIESLPCNDDVKKIQAISDFWERGLIITKAPLEIEDE